jgi:hypothetical protein
MFFGAETIDDFYVYQECGTPISDNVVIILKGNGFMRSGVNTNKFQLCMDSINRR